MLRTRELLAEPPLRKRSGTYLPKYLRISNALRLDGQNPQGAESALYSAYSTRVCYGASPSAFFRNIYHRTIIYKKVPRRFVGRRTSLRYPSVVLSYHIHVQFANPTKVALNFSISFSGL